METNFKQNNGDTRALCDNEIEMVNGGILPVLVAVPVAAFVFGAGVRAGAAAYQAYQASR